jgi:sugar/nucleoside kinase (ribokinase family)
MLDILCVGDAKIDIFLRIPESNPYFGLDKANNKLLISFGEKIHVERYILGIGGNAANTAVGISRLGLNTGLCAEIGKDELSQKILNHLKKENVNTDLLIQTDEDASVSVALSYQGERTLLTEHVKRNHDFNFEKIETRFIYLTSLGDVWQNAYEKTLEFTKKANVKLAFNPGSVQLENRGKVVMDIIENCDYLFVNKEEAEEILYGKELGLERGNENQIKKLLYGLRGLGVKNVAITDGDNGSYVESEKNETYHLGIIKVDVSEKTGAGDAYSAGFLAAIIHGLEIPEAMKWGALNSANVIKGIGAEVGLLTKPEMEEKLKSDQDFKTENL